MKSYILNIIVVYTIYVVSCTNIPKPEKNYAVPMVIKKLGIESSFFRLKAVIYNIGQGDSAYFRNESGKFDTIPLLSCNVCNDSTVYTEIVKDSMLVVVCDVSIKNKIADVLGGKVLHGGIISLKTKQLVRLMYGRALFKVYHNDTIFTDLRTQVQASPNADKWLKEYLY